LRRAHGVRSIVTAGERPKVSKWLEKARPAE